MITYVNSKEAKLFELAAAELGLESLDVGQYLDNLSKLKMKSPRFVRLPLYEDGHQDEEIFIINANERTIKVPSSFSKNGVGVVSDELAETLWFRINRYFDIKDFGKAAGHDVSDNLKDGDLHILIQWEAPDGAKGASWAYAVDVDTDPEYVYFGWALTAEHLTAKAGNIKFAVRIMQYDKNEQQQDVIAYSFATQSATVTVKAGLSFDLTQEGIKFESVADKIASRIMDGQIAHCPVFAEDGDLPAYVLNLAEPPAETVLEVIAAAPEGDAYDAMAYKWYKKGLTDEDFVQVTDEYSPALTVTSSGQYYVVVFGMKEIVDGLEYIYDGENVSDEEVKFRYHTSVASSKSTVCEIPAPIALDIITENENKLVIGVDPALLLVINRQEIAGNPVGTVTLGFEKTASAEKDLDLETAEFLPVDISSTPGAEAVSEAWIWNEVEYATEEEAIAAKGEEEGEIIHREAQEAIPAQVAPISYEFGDDGEIRIDMSNAEEGYYRITVINTLNGDHKDTISSVICRVVKPAKVDAVSAVMVKPDGSPVEAKGVANQDKIVANVTIDGLSDELQIKWYKVAGGYQDQDPILPEDSALDILISQGEKLEFMPDDDGSYYFIAINKVEDSENALASNVVEFTA